MIIDTKIDSYLTSHMDQSIAELSRLCAQPSVSAQNWGLAECAELGRRTAAKAWISKTRYHAHRWCSSCVC